MKKLLTITLLATSLFAVDYTTMSIDELSNLRGSVPSEDREAFRSAFQEKTKYLTPEEKVQYSRGKGKGNGQMTQEQKREQHQERLREMSGYGDMNQDSRGGGFGGGNGRGGGGGRR